MRTSNITIDGNSHLLCFSTRAVTQCNDKYGSVEKMYDAMDKADGSGLGDAIWLLSVMLSAGDRYAKKNGIDNPAPLTYDDLLDTFGLDDLQEIMATIGQATAAGTETTVEVEDSKNAQTTKGE